MSPHPEHKRGDDHGNTKFGPEKREEYLGYLRSGNLKFESARLAGISYKTVERRRKMDEEFVEDERRALAEAREGVEKVLYDMAAQGDLGAIKMWLTAHDRSTYGDKKTLEVDATPAAVELSHNQAMAKVAELQATLAERRLALAADDDVIDVDGDEV